MWAALLALQGLRARLCWPSVSQALMGAAVLSVSSKRRQITGLLNSLYKSLRLRI